MKNNKNNKNNPKMIIAIVTAVVVGAVVIFLVAANFIVVDECGSPCKKNDGQVCAAVCERVTLMDRILGRG